MQELFYAAGFIAIMAFGAKYFTPLIIDNVFHLLKDAVRTTITFAFITLFILAPTSIILVDNSLIKLYYLIITPAYVVIIGMIRVFFRKLTY